MKTPRFLKVTALIWLVGLLATLAYRYSPWMMTGKWYGEDFGIVIIRFNGSATINGTEVALEKTGFHTFHILAPSEVAGGQANPVKVTRNFGSMTWSFDHRDIIFKKLPAGKTATVDHTLEDAPQATLIRRWSENARPQRLIVLPDGTTGFDDNLIRIFLNSKHTSTLSPDQWLTEFSSLIHTGELISSLREIRGYAERPMKEPPSAISTTTKNPDGSSTVIRHSYRDLQGVVYRHEATFHGGQCLTLTHQKIGQDIGHAKYFQ